MRKISLIIVVISFCFSSCSSGGDSVNSPIDPGGESGSGNPETNNDIWSIPIQEVRDGGPGRDGIPSIDSPKFITAEEAPGLLAEEVRVIGIKIGDEVRAYPHYILDWHEVVNDALENSSVAITYCPLTGTAIGWNRIIDGKESSFGVSGLLYNNNLIPFDRLTNSNWSQVGLQCVNGELIGEKPELIKLVETNWFIWKSMYPETKILSTNTGFSREYGVYPYGDYRSNNDYLIFPLSRDDLRLPRKERVHALIGENDAKAYRFNAFSGGKVIRDIFKGKEILLVGGQETIVSFELDNELSLLDFQYVFNGSEVYFRDNEGTEWNVFGEGMSGPRKGQKLTPTKSFIAYWFSIGAFYPNAEIY